MIAYKFTYNSSSRQQQIIVATNSKGGSGGGIGEGSVYTNIWVCHYFGCYFAAQDVAVFFLYYIYVLEQQQATALFFITYFESKTTSWKSLGKKRYWSPKGEYLTFNLAYRLLNKHFYIFYISYSSSSSSSAENSILFVESFHLPTTTCSPFLTYSL